MMFEARIAKLEALIRNLNARLSTMPATTAGTYLTQANAATNYVKLDGSNDPMTGELIVRDKIAAQNAAASQTIDMHVHSSGQTRLQSTNWLRFRPLNGYNLMDVSGSHNLFWVYNAAQDDYCGMQAGAATHTITTNKY